MSGFARGRVNYPPSAGGRPGPNPFRNNKADGNPAYWGDREKVGYEFKANRLVDSDGDGFPAYLDGLGTDKPIAYFRAEGTSGYDPNDVNIPESGVIGTPAVAVRKFRVAFVVTPGQAMTNTNREAVSPGPNPYTSSLANTGSTVAWHRQASFQLISAGADGLFGLGGAYQEAKTPRLIPEGGAANTNDPDSGLRSVEQDNLTNFASGRLE
jgi:hypothetical protein